MAYDRRVDGQQAAHGSHLDYRLLVGRAEIPVGKARGYTSLDAARAATLEAWVATLIPASGSRPDAAAVGAGQYIDATVAEVPALLPGLREAIDRLQELAFERAGRPFGESDATDRELILREFEATDETDVFSMVRDFTYESYYGHPTVLAALERDTGWRGGAPGTGSSLPGFDQSRLDRVRALPPRWRRTGQGDGVGS